jgi:hypothetical protein
MGNNMRQPFNDARYDSIADFLSAVQLKPLNVANTSYWAHFMDGHNGDWYGADCGTGHDVLKVMSEGWEQGRARLNALRDQIGEVDLVPVDRRRRPVRADQGDVLDIFAVYNGRLDIAWRTAKRRSTVAPTRIDICANMICSGGEHSDVLFWRGAAAATLADILEQAGYMVRLVVNFGGSTGDNAKGNERTSCRIIVKDHGMPFDVTSTSAVILPGFFRALGHAWIQSHAPGRRDMNGIYVGEGVIEDSEILLSHDVRDHGTALAFVRDQIAKLNGEEAA